MQGGKKLAKALALDQTLVRQQVNGIRSGLDLLLHRHSDGGLGLGDRQNIIHTEHGVHGQCHGHRNHHNKEHISGLYAVAFFRRLAFCTHRRGAGGALLHTVRKIVVPFTAELRGINTILSLI